MAYIKNTWVDQDVERPKTYEVTNNQDGSITLTDSFGLVTELGTPVNAVNMNHIEGGIESNDIRIGDLDDLITTAKDNLVDAVNEIAGLGDKADTDLSNLTVTGKDNVLKLAYELDLDNKITVTTTVSSSMRSYTIPQDGIITIYAYGTGSSTGTKTIQAGVFTSSSGATTDAIEHNAWVSTAAAAQVGLGVSFSYLKDETCYYIANASGFSNQNHAYVYFIPFKKS